MRNGGPGLPANSSQHKLKQGARVSWVNYLKRGVHIRDKR